MVKVRELPLSRDYITEATFDASPFVVVVAVCPHLRPATHQKSSKFVWRAKETEGEFNPTARDLPTFNLTRRQPTDDSPRTTPIRSIFKAEHLFWRTSKHNNTAIMATAGKTK